MLESSEETKAVSENEVCAENNIVIEDKKKEIQEYSNTSVTETESKADESNIDHS